MLKYQLEKGAVTFTVPCEFSIQFTLSPREEHPWRILNFKILAKSKLSVYKGKKINNNIILHVLEEIPTELYEHQLNSLKKQIQEKIQHSSSSLVDVYRLLHHFTLRYQIYIFSAQAQFLSTSRWKKLLNVETGQGVLKLQFWTNNSNTFYF